MGWFLRMGRNTLRQEHRRGTMIQKSRDALATCLTPEMLLGIGMTSYGRTVRIREAIGGTRASGFAVRHSITLSSEGRVRSPDAEES